MAARDRFLLFLRNRRNWFVAAYFAWFLLPLVLDSLYRPFALWDHLTSAELFHFGLPIEWRRLASNAFHHLLTGTFVVRPTTAFLYDLQVLLFGGEFWLWYAVKWTACGATAGLAVHLLRRMGCGWEAQTAAVSLLLFHPARFTLMLHAPDGWLALGICAQLALLWRHEFRASAMTASMQVLWFALALFTIGTKEAGLVFQALLTMFVLGRGPAAWMRLLPHGGLLAVWMWRLQAASGRAGGFVFGEWISRAREQAAMLMPTSTLHVFELMLLGLAGYSCAIAWKRRGELLGQAVLFCWAAVVCMAAFVTVPKLVALRYAVPMVYLAVIPVGVAVQNLGRYRGFVAAALVAVYPIVTAGHVYRQVIAYRDQTYQTAELVRRMETKARSGCQLVVSGMDTDIAGEPLGSLDFYFGKRGVAWYGLRQARVLHRAREKGWPAECFAMASYFGPEQMIRESGFDMRRLERVEVLHSGDMGAIGRLSGWYRRFDRLVRRPGSYTIDLGAPEPTTQPRFYLYTAGPVGTVREGGWILEPVPVGRRSGAF
jgi:hypothetical protein